ncbi:MAG TPA: nucleotidyltransferase domain-containing protein [Candidatus Limnocylindria bacterium]|jgi:predicted nucleotidyltransferase/DNA-binding XRE family transcriptional regulator
MRPSGLLRGARKRAGLSQAALAERAKTSQSAVARYEAGVTIPSLATLERLLAACGESVVLGNRTSAPASRRRRGDRRFVAVQAARKRLLDAALRHGLRDVRVFGSVARGEETEASDVDLLVDLGPGRTLIDLIGFQQEAEQILGVRVDAVTERILKRRVRSGALRDIRRL